MNTEQKPETNIFGVPKPDKLPRNTVSYEWRTEEVEIASVDIVDTVGHDNLEKAVARWKSKPDDGNEYQLCLTRLLCNAWEGILDRQYAYVEGGELPAEFEGGAKVPEVYRKAFAKAVS